MSSNTKHTALKDYCCSRKLNRPKTNAATAVKSLFGLQIITTLFTVALSYLVKSFDVALADWFLHLLANLFSIVVFFKKICVVSIELYQHYAPESMRRRCTLVPSCSEYALLALQKHGTLIGIYKTYDRLFKKCVGNVYVIDYP